MAMSDKRVAREFFEAHLPEDLRNLADLNKLELEPGSYIDDVRQESITDMLFKTQIDGHLAYLYLTVEHQSRPDSLMPFRILSATRKLSQVIVAT
jgi:predicted transposase/invertase (TIGR01784 family)